MSPDLLPWLGLAAQITGAVILAFSGGFGLGARKYDARGTAIGLAIFLAGCVSMAVYAVYERHLLMTAAQIIAAVLISYGVARKVKSRQGG